MCEPEEASQSIEHVEFSELFPWVEERAKNLWTRVGRPRHFGHFTSTEAAGAIQVQGVLHATSLERLQHGPDRLEWRLGWGVARTALASAAEAEGSELAKCLARRFADDEGPFPATNTANIACFTDAYELDRTRAYFQSVEKAELIRFDYEQVNRMMTGAMERGQGARLWQVSYDLDHLLDVATQITLETLERVNRQTEPDDEASLSRGTTKAFYALRTPLVHMSLAFKRPQYSDESEWRIICTGIAEEGPRRMPERIDLRFR